ncbi:DUF397 domain-containing protein [Saccharopolyspora gloriosae]|uniref:DUF397 domain-containing protein n=1 Tax=Saccharopolyspora gloriosae TaxID=455344 RepID=A0A840NSB4_9PSEU|nr:DUF397 domain-containing protein [Saccharopolyspora gloriosae]MBB5072042.1 hypothetical protein [Saccharopolyspora gloriosae]
MAELKWRKSTWSGDYNCVEVALSPGSTAVRDSKAPEDGHFTVPAAQWGFFLHTLKSGRFDR